LTQQSVIQSDDTIVLLLIVHSGIETFSVHPNHAAAWRALMAFVDESMGETGMSGLDEEARLALLFSDKEDLYILADASLHPKEGARCNLLQSTSTRSRLGQRS